MMDKIEFPDTNIVMENGKMRLLAYAKLLNKKINCIEKKVNNPFFNTSISRNPFNRHITNTLVWVELDENQPTKNNNNGY